MARLLVAARARRRGEVVALKPDSHVWGAKERDPDFVRVDVTDLPLPEVAQARLGFLIHPALVLNPDTLKLDHLHQRRFVVEARRVEAWIAAADWQVALTEAGLRADLALLRDDGRVHRPARAADLDTAIARLAARNEVI